MIPSILREVPYSLETERLFLRQPEPGDGAQLFEAVEESREELERWLEWFKTNPNAMDVEAKLRAYRIHCLERTHLIYQMIRKEDQQMLGTCGLYRIDWSVPRFEIGYWIRTGATGQGLVTEAVYRLMKVAFVEFNAQRVEIRCDAENKRSSQVAERAGFTLEGILRNEMRSSEGCLVHTAIYGMTPDEYKEWIAKTTIGCHETISKRV
ncbi:GNAT family N-acetyltransferase [Marininema halotolerans]|uniref:Protein N-acetyltransferase, RimJ/RimL family n=1 Tax=Marininema halotolerans TaxID=1155944 RepID=A0A1I6R2L9_9BACL|nr:GNAT family N-acetyltransferase [Marininema halotolerans]SFS58840.1 Protein N-acetyltransferase, RimJ/RimL family [Marininema halotolerans]